MLWCTYYKKFAIYIWLIMPILFISMLLNRTTSITIVKEKLCDLKFKLTICYNLIFYKILLAENIVKCGFPCQEGIWVKCEM